MGGQYYNRFYRNRYRYEELGSFGSGYGLLESRCECGNEPPGDTSYGIS